MTDFKVGDIVTTGMGITGRVTRCNKRIIKITSEYCEGALFTRGVFFRLCTPDEIKDYWTERRDVAVADMNRLKLVAEDAELALYVLETGK